MIGISWCRYIVLQSSELLPPNWSEYIGWLVGRLHPRSSKNGKNWMGEKYNKNLPTCIPGNGICRERSQKCCYRKCIRHFFLFSSVHEVIKNPVSFQYYLAQVHFCESFANSGSSVETVLRSSGQRARPLLCRSELETLQSQHFNSNSFTWFLWKSESMKLSERFQNVNFGTPQKPCGQSYKTFYVSKLWL